MTRSLAASIAMTAVGIVLLILSYFPIGLSEWLPRWAMWLGAVWIAVVGIGLTLMLTASDE